MGWLERMDQRNQRHVDRANVLWSNENYEATIEAQPGPRWAWALSALPFVGIIGTVVIAVDTWRRRHRRGPVSE